MAKRGSRNGLAATVLMDTNNQKTHYFIDPRKRQKTGGPLSSLANVFNVLRPESKKNTHKTPFNPLLNTKESSQHVKHRYNLYNQVWQNQLEKIDFILNNTNTQLFQDLLSYIKQPPVVKDDFRRVGRIIKTQSHKLPVGFLSLTSNTANNTRILQELLQFLHEQNELDDSLDLKAVSLNSKNCVHAKAALRETIRQFLNLKVKKPVPNQVISVAEASEDEEKEDEEKEAGQRDEQEDEEEDGFDEDQNDEQVMATLKGRISYDLDILEEWCNNHYRKTNTDVYNTNLRIIIIVEEADSVDNDVLNQLIKLFHSYSNRLPIYFFMALSSSNVSNWINTNLNNTLRTIINGIKFESNDNKDLGYDVLSKLFLNHEITPDAPISLDSRLALIILNRFENSNNSIDSLVASLKLSYMIYFYQSPLSILVDSKFEPTQLHIDSLRKLPSFKKVVEFKLHQFTELKKELADDRLTLAELYSENDERFQEKENTITKLKDEIKALLNSNDKSKELLANAKKDFQIYRNSIINAVNLLYKFDPFQKEKFEIYKLITNNQLINSGYLSDCLRSVKNLPVEDVQELSNYILESDDIRSVLNESVTDDYILRLQVEIRSLNFKDEENIQQDLRNLLTKYFNGNSHLNKKINDNLFNEILTIDGGVSELELLKPLKFVEENLDNLMINLVRPSLRSVLELGLNDSSAYLNNDLVKTDTKSELPRNSLSPMVSRLYNIYKDAPISINLYDFYVAFKQSLLKSEIINELSSNVDKLASDKDAYSKIYLDIVKQLRSDEIEDTTWNKLTYAWFLQSCFELVAMGFLKEKTKNDFLEKGVWKNI